MKLLGRNKLQSLYGANDATDKWLVSWTSEVSRANWKHANDVLRQFPSVKRVNDSVFRFRVGPQVQCIEVAMLFPQALAIVTDLKHIN